jgi:predicted nucleotidyltransferase
MGEYLTISERKAAQVAAISKGINELAPVLAAYAREHGGRFILFGSAARGDLRFDSDVDVLVDFPVEEEPKALIFAEDACIHLGLRADILSAWMVADRLRERAEREGRILA